MSDEIRAELAQTPEWWQGEFDALERKTAPPLVRAVRAAVARLTPAPEPAPARIELIDVPRRWWQSKQIRLRCTCGWESPDTFYARPPAELWYTERVLIRASIELHWLSSDHTEGARP